ncbi:bifunctional 2',3'-cyclic-nucleotide 2'-phosphodiesterase/3'-nucleotidase [Rummeliibacillus sp. G93]|uniref:bifunctional 2',3'-cyclic-nucleotide 2'-phosphodiesterase/3'-nucleotidase n=1 Tax=Rummeliibacillus TaxID=648802 RepID=UPI00116FEC3B|nr:MULTISPECIES: bifunctional 2',3'-cyclic-nucleotide 2'-phosphodiesterase/3'-nucleotidase [Rummeliibacillus]MBB5169101.1 2',3'-cyclic-nucleotide 2'-phosphodiesterase/3'-nucleotidase/5'-nucleotidase [Rummeliibacillus stabekisii]UQW96147.1 bifunctional 2',3'-cyclic-nucleotide 2'-phosphodiesterase/3'-nucleotidase [Rummeliibacillus sp. G93]GEL06451.1 2',3'-cyclic-nucleotide 2'-phosphodiesterase [Rummeliibacillus stabekisii]
MKSTKKFQGLKVLSSALALSLIASSLTPIMETEAQAKTAKTKVQSQVKLRIMETTDVHTNLLDFDYYKNSVAPQLGLAKTATLVNKARKEVKNSVLVDNGDLIQGTPLGTYKATIDPLKKNEVHPMIKAMNIMKYDMASLGNHEFNFGLNFLKEVYNDATFGFVNANVYKDDHDNNPNNDKNQFTPYKIVNKKVKDESGKTQTIKVGYIGFVPPQISEWDKANLNNKVIVKGIVETAKKYVPIMKKKGADVVIAMPHSGFNKDVTNTEDTIYALSKVKGIDAITFSHTHKVFPAKDIASLDSIFKDEQGNAAKGVDNKKGTINGVPAVQAGFGGGALGIIDLTLKKIKGKWAITKSKSQAQTRSVLEEKADEKIKKAILKDHEATLKYINTPIGKTTDDIYSYFALVQDDPSIQVVTSAQKWFVEKYVALNKPELKDLPILSVGAPFKAGRNGKDEYTDIKKGDLTIRSAGDLYLYDNTLKALKVKGSNVKEWLEMVAGAFNTIDTSKTTEQSLLNPTFPVYNFDVIDGVQYQIDVTKPAKYSTTGQLENPTSSRIVNLTYDGKPIDPNQEFIVVTNNYRASGGGHFPGISESELVVDSADENRQILMDYISEVKEITPTADNNWSIAPIAQKVNVTFTTSPQAVDYIKEGSLFTYTGKTDVRGFGIFQLNLNR